MRRRPDHQRPLEQSGRGRRVAGDLNGKPIARPREHLEGLSGELTVALVPGEGGQIDQRVRERDVRVQRPERPVAQTDALGGTVEERVLVVESVDRRLRDGRRVLADAVSMVLAAVVSAASTRA